MAIYFLLRYERLSDSLGVISKRGLLKKVVNVEILKVYC